MKKLSILVFFVALFSDSLQERGKITTIHPDLDIPSEDKCGSYDSDAYRIYNGEIADLYDHPWYALISINDRGDTARCGGSLINPLFVLSAAHCYEKIARQRTDIRSPSEVSVVLGEHTIGKNPDCDESDDSCYSAITMNVSRIFIHDKYKGKIGSFSNDIALLRLKWAMNFNNGDSLMKPVCLPVSDELINFDLVRSFMTSTGFGRIEDGSLSNVKRKVDLQVISTAECQEFFNKKQFQLNKNSQNIPITINEQTQICAIGTKNEDTCNGDSGGPFVRGDKYLMGLVSFGPEECGTGDFPAIFTKISYYIDWIRATMRKR